jgi:hypothetical protein
MKATHLILALLMAPATLASADPAYTLSQICNHYTDSETVCESIPFCHTLTTTTKGACKSHQPHMAQLCANQGNMGGNWCEMTVGCYPETTTTTACVAKRSEL